MIIIRSVAALMFLVGLYCSWGIHQFFSSSAYSIRDRWAFYIIELVILAVGNILLSVWLFRLKKIAAFITVYFSFAMILWCLWRIFIWQEADYLWGLGIYAITLSFLFPYLFGILEFPSEEEDD